MPRSALAQESLSSESHHQLAVARMFLAGRPLDVSKVRGWPRCFYSCFPYIAMFIYDDRFFHVLRAQNLLSLSLSTSFHVRLTGRASGQYCLATGLPQSRVLVDSWTCFPHCRSAYVGTYSSLHALFLFLFLFPCLLVLCSCLFCVCLYCLIPLCSIICPRASM